MGAPLRVMVLVPLVPRRLDEKTPWHFFQELEALVELGLHLSVVSPTVPEYRLPRVEFSDARHVPLRRSPRALLAAVRLDRMVSRRVGGWRGIPWSQRLRVASRNLPILDHAKRWRPHIMHSHWAFPLGSGGMPVASVLDIPLVMTLRGMDHLINVASGFGECLDPLWERTLRAALQGASRITVTCQDSVARLRELGVEGSERVTKLYHAVDPRRFSGTREDADAFVRGLGLDQSRLIVSCVAWMDFESKGHRDLLRAWQGVVAEHDAVLLLVGDGRIRPSLEALARKIGVADRVVFAGLVHPAEVQHVLRMSTLTVLPTHTEAFGNVVSESLLVGTPVVTSRVGAPGEIVSKGPFGAVYEPGDVEALRAAILTVLTNVPQFREMAARGSAFVTERLSVEQRARGFLNEYGKALRPAD